MPYKSSYKKKVTRKPRKNFKKNKRIVKKYNKPGRTVIPKYFELGNPKTNGIKI